MNRRTVETKPLTNADVASFVEAAESRPTTHVDGMPLGKRLNKIDPFRMFLVRRHNKWLRKQCEKLGVPLEEVTWWEL